MKIKFPNTLPKWWFAILICSSLAACGGGSAADGGVGSISQAPAAVTEVASVTNVQNNDISPTGSIPNGGNTVDSTPLISGSASANLPSGYAVRVYDNAALLGTATLSGATWSLIPASPLTASQHSFKAVVARNDGIEGPYSNAWILTISSAAVIQTSTISNVQNNDNSPVVSVASGGSTADTTPLLSGSVNSVLPIGYTVHVYDSDVKLGAASLSSTSWTYLPSSPLSLGIHIFRTVVTRSDGSRGTFSSTWTITINALNPTFKLPHTGIAACYELGGFFLIPCTYGSAIALSGEGKQDGMYSGINSMSYGPVGNYPSSSCVKDNVTGLIWEGKNATGLRAGSRVYTNYDSTAAQQKYDGILYIKPTQVEITDTTNSIGYINYVNSIALCGYTDWRLPSVDELETIVNIGIQYPGPTIDGTWFPNLPSSSWVWSSSPYVSRSGDAWSINFGNGNAEVKDRSNGYGDGYGSIRLVRGS